MYYKNINSINRLNIESNTTITDVANWLFAQFQTGIRPLNIFQASNIVVFNETGNFNIICTKFVDGDQLTGIAVNHWTGNTFSFAIDYDRSWFWKRMATYDDIKTQEISLQNNWIWSSGSLKMQRILNCVFLEFEAIGGVTSEQTTIAIIPEHWRPFNWKTTIGFSNRIPVPIIIGTDGRIYCHESLPIDDIVINTMWMI